MGCAWLLDRWGELRDLLEAGEAWQPPDRFRAIRLLGRQPLDMEEDARVMAIYLGCSAMQPPEGSGVQGPGQRAALEQQKRFDEWAGQRGVLGGTRRTPRRGRRRCWSCREEEERGWRSG